LEQAHDYLSPIIRKALNGKGNIKLIKRPKYAKQFPKGALFSILSFTTPDVLITAVKNNIEYPLVIIEFTEAVTTEDHELQRTYGAFATYLSNIFYVKISGNKQSKKEFGGAEYNPFSTPKMLLERYNYEAYIIAEWQTNDLEKSNLQKHKKLKSCPPDIQLLTDTLQTIVRSFIKSEKRWFVHSINLLKQYSSYITHRKKIECASDSNELLQEWRNREQRNNDPNKLRYFIREKWIGAKINRFSHAMDPDRGILNFISFVFSNTHKIYGIYSLVRPRGNEVLKGKLNNITLLRAKLKEAIVKDHSGVPTWFSDELIKATLKTKTLNETVNFQDVWEKHKDKIATNKVVLTIAFLLDGLYLNHNGIKLVWNRRKLLGNSKLDTITLLRTYFSSTQLNAPARLSQETDEVNEDEVTYALVHRVLLPNRFKIVSVSYPGAQGSQPVLPKIELGKAQPREYIDIIALPPIKTSQIDVLLNESKGMFKRSEIDKDHKKLMRYKQDENMKKALKETLAVAQVIDKDNKLRSIIIGISFGTKKNVVTKWRPNEVDFIFRITDRRKWAIGVFNQRLRNLIPKIEGNTNFPVVYKLSTQDSKE